MKHTSLEETDVEMGTGCFLHMEENITTIKKLQNKIITKLQMAAINLIKEHFTRKDKHEEDRKWKMTM